MPSTKVVAQVHPKLSLRQTLRYLSHLDLTNHIFTKDPKQKSNGGYNDIFQSKMFAGWQPRPDPNIAGILKLVPDPTVKLGYSETMGSF